MTLRSHASANFRIGSTRQVRRNLSSGPAVRPQHRRAPRPAATSRSVTPHQVDGRHRAASIHCITLSDGKGQRERAPSRRPGAIGVRTTSGGAGADAAISSVRDHQQDAPAGAFVDAVVGLCCLFEGQWDEEQTHPVTPLAANGPSCGPSRPRCGPGRPRWPWSPGSASCIACCARPVSRTSRPRTARSTPPRSACPGSSWRSPPGPVRVPGRTEIMPCYR